jgi:hypothetical protein
MQLACYYNINGNSWHTAIVLIEATGMHVATFSICSSRWHVPIVFVAAVGMPLLYGMLLLFQ